MREASFFWHDYETWGADPRRDRVAQFAGVRTDRDLNPIEAPVVCYCRPGDDLLPHPDACRITGISPQRAQREGLRETEFFALVHGQLSRPGTCGCGYNSLRFDDEFTRYGLWRNFFDPYAREWQNGNGRWDIIDMVRLTRALRPQGMEWPVREDGAPSFRLEELTQANGIEHQSAHDALSDVYATIALARLIRERQPRLYHYVLEHKDKERAGGLFDLQALTPVVHISGMYPAVRGSLAVVVPLLRHPTNRNGVVVYDLQQDPQEWLDLDQEVLARRLYTSAAELGSEESRVLLKTVHLNRCPVVVPLSTLTSEAIEEWGIDLERCERHRQILLNNDHWRTALASLFTAPEQAGSSDSDQALYGGFLGEQDRRLCERIRRLSPEELASGGFVFQDGRLQELLFRYRARNWPESLTAEERARWHEFRWARLTEANGGGSITWADYQIRLAELRAQEPERAALWDALVQWPVELGMQNE